MSEFSNFLNWKVILNYIHTLHTPIVSLNEPCHFTRKKFWWNKWLTNKIFVQQTMICLILQEICKRKTKRNRFYFNFIFLSFLNSPGDFWNIYHFKVHEFLYIFIFVRITDNPLTDLPQTLIWKLGGTADRFLAWFENSKLSGSTFMGLID